MARQRKANKSLIEELRKMLHSLTKPKRVPRKARKRKTVTDKKAASTASKTESSAQNMQKKLEWNLTRKMTKDMQKIKREVEQQLFEKLTSQKANASEGEEARSQGQKTKGRKSGKLTAEGKSPRTGESSVKTAKRVFKPKSDCTLLKLLTLSDRQERKVVVGYEVLDTSSQVIWGINIHEGARLARNMKIQDTKVRSRKVGNERQYYLVHVTNDALYYSDEYAKAVIERGKLTVVNYTIGLAEAIKSAYDAGYTNSSEWPETV